MAKLSPIIGPMECTVQLNIALSGRQIWRFNSSGIALNWRPIQEVTIKIPQNYTLSVFEHDLGYMAKYSPKPQGVIWGFTLGISLIGQSAIFDCISFVLS